MSEQDTVLRVLARADATRSKAFAESLVRQFGTVGVPQSRTGLVVLPIRDTAQGVAWHLGEVLVSEAHIRARAATAMVCAGGGTSRLRWRWPSWIRP